MIRQMLIAALLLAALPLAARAGTPLTAVQVATGLQAPIMVKSPPGDFSRAFVVERHGRVMLIKNGVLQATPFIDISGDVQSSDGERGLLDIAFHPNYASNGYFYLRYTNGLDPAGGPNPFGPTVIKRFTRSRGNGDLANPASGFNIVRVGSTTGFHIGGSIDFGRDGFLYVTVGDAADPTKNNAQDLTNIYGKILRIDPSGDAFPGDANNNYSIPPGNPFAGATAGADEIWAYGLRNPFRTAFDRVTGALWIADVGGGGENAREEINFLALGAAGKNLGWPCKEGSYCDPTATQCSCSDPTLVNSIFEYDHDLGLAVIGGRVYRGCAIPDLVGTYFLADWTSGNIWSFRYSNGVISELNPNRASEIDTPSISINSIVGIGEDARGELYICSLSGGKVYKIIPAIAPPDSNSNGIPDTCEFSAGDVNQDGSTNVSDLLAVISAWGPCFECPADIAPSPTGDGQVNVTDLLLVISDWG